MISRQDIAFNFTINKCTFIYGSNSSCLLLEWNHSRLNVFFNLSRKCE